MAEIQVQLSRASGGDRAPQKSATKRGNQSPSRCSSYSSSSILPPPAKKSTLGPATVTTVPGTPSISFSFSAVSSSVSAVPSAETTLPVRPSTSFSSSIASNLPPFVPESAVAPPAPSYSTLNPADVSDLFLSIDMSDLFFPADISDPCFLDSGMAGILEDILKSAESAPLANVPPVASEQVTGASYSPISPPAVSATGTIPTAEASIINPPPPPPSSVSSLCDSSLHDRVIPPLPGPATSESPRAGTSAEGSLANAQETQNVG